MLAMHHDVPKSTSQGLGPIEVQLSTTCQRMVPCCHWILLCSVSTWRRAMLPKDRTLHRGLSHVSCVQKLSTVRLELQALHISCVCIFGLACGLGSANSASKAYLCCTCVVSFDRVVMGSAHRIKVGAPLRVALRNLNIYGYVVPSDFFRRSEGAFLVEAA